MAIRSIQAYQKISLDKTTETLQLIKEHDAITIFQNPVRLVRPRGRPKKSQPSAYTIPKSNFLEIKRISPLDKATSDHKKNLKRKKRMPTLRMIKVEGNVWSSSVVPKHDLATENLENTIEKLKRRVSDSAFNELAEHLEKRKRGRPRKVPKSCAEEDDNNELKVPLGEDSKNPGRRSRRSQNPFITYEEFQEDLEDIRNQPDIKPKSQTTENGIKKGRGRPPKYPKSQVMLGNDIKKKRGRPRKKTSIGDDQSLPDSKPESTTPLLSLFESLQLSIEDNVELVQPKSEISSKCKLEYASSMCKNENYKTKMPSTSFLEQKHVPAESSNTSTKKSALPTCVKDIIPNENETMKNTTMTEQLNQPRVRLIRMDLNPCTMKKSSNVISSLAKIMKRKRGRPRLNPIINLESIKIPKKHEQPIKIDKETVEVLVESNNIAIRNENSTDSVNPPEILKAQLGNISDVVHTSNEANTSHMVNIPEALDTPLDNTSDTLSASEAFIIQEDHNTDSINQSEAIKADNCQGCLP
ncbi:uncharacterized protein LOC131667008 [Phymastichus coffea]|uniref:uncharacterized protein LOC131667008 n=1 Tax=Phymastichus coffea TaxID=108790 RepID=UPI00273B42C9|nr:uncharacterized protein LOC131667008 [Phymastichus coffea]